MRRVRCLVKLEFYDAVNCYFELLIGLVAMDTAHEGR